MSRPIVVDLGKSAVELVFWQAGLPRGRTNERRSRRWRRARRMALMIMRRHTQGSLYWIETDDGVVKRMRDMLTWARWMQGHRRVALDAVGIVEVSTVFLGIDHGWGQAPVLWETMVFRPTAPEGERWADYQERYTSRAAALEGHARIVERARTGEFDPITEAVMEDEHGDRG